MPEIVVHHFFGEKVAAGLPEEITDRIIPAVYRIGVRGPDPLGIIRFWYLPAWKKKHSRSNVMHTQKAECFFQRLALETKVQTGELRKQLFSYACGFLTHYFLDSICHPYVIYRTGHGKECSGNHRSLEHAMDRAFLKQNGMVLTQRPITRQILQSKGLPASMQKSVDAVYADVFNWPGAWREINHALRDEKRFLRMMEDPKGKMDRMIKRITQNGNLRSLSYAERAYENADIKNEMHQTWHNPYDPAVQSSQSFPELQTEAMRQATEAICGLFDYVFHDSPYPDCIGNRSYESGFDTEDVRNNNIPISDCLRR